MMHNMILILVFWFLLAPSTGCCRHQCILRWTSRLPAAAGGSGRRLEAAAAAATQLELGAGGRISWKQSRDLSQQGVVSYVVTHGHARPLKGVAREKHVPDKCLNGSLTDQTDKEELFYHRRGNCAE